MASAHWRSGVRGLPPPNRWVFLCFGIKRCSRVHKASDTRKLVVTLFTGARGRRFLICTMTLLYHIPVIRIGSYSTSVKNSGTKCSFGLNKKGRDKRVKTAKNSGGILGVWEQDVPVLMVHVK